MVRKVILNTYDVCIGHGYFLQSEFEILKTDIVF
jgi:hypothetical protein